ncbi:hypothetical protein JOC77_004148 [Peribacillus deserti]|uniref:Lipoprotein n=1 Tax=Peribacillus deserti TaxID=673318 RepID=A0ABS2QNC8_9BACI|nr:hypothetical protein [Peribacillus deserti]MBM7694671.1 hypothetical protein [Peribacillus deserti]
MGVTTMPILILFSSLFLLSGCDGNLYEQLRQNDFLENRCLSAEFEQLQKLGIKGYSKDSFNNVIFYVENPNDKTKKKVSIDFSLEDADQLNVKPNALPFPVSLTIPK